MISVTTGGLKGGAITHHVKKKKKKTLVKVPFWVSFQRTECGQVLSLHYKYTRPLCRLRPHSIHVEPALTCWPRPLKHPPLLLKQDCLFLYKMSCTVSSRTHTWAWLRWVTSLTPVPAGREGRVNWPCSPPTEQDEEESEEDVDPQNLYLA